MDFTSYLEKEKLKTQAVVSLFLKRTLAYYQNLDESFLTFFENLEAYSLRSGKWHRPTLVRLAYDICKADKTEGDILMSSGSVELLHRFILIHDDIIDGDLTRHAGPTLERVYAQEQEDLKPVHPIRFYDKGMALISGDLLHTLALEIVREAKLPEKITLNVLRGLHECLAVTAAGWRLETMLKQQPLQAVEKNKIEKAMWLVSGQYSILWPLRIGQLLAGVEYGQWHKALEEYSLHLGRAFQLQDDILGLIGHSEVTGKPVGNDFREGKKTLPLYYAYTNSRADEQKFLNNTLGKPLTTQDAIRLKDILSTSEAIQKTRLEITQSITKAMSVLEKLPSKSQASTLRLVELSEYLGNREK